MALALVGGVLVSTLLTLFVVPAGYSAIEGAIAWNRSRRAARGDRQLASS